jgi:hypothetical protein
MTAEAELASLRATVENLSRSVQQQWDMIQRLSEHEQNDRLILHRLSEIEKKLDGHSATELKRAEEQHERITKLETAHSEFDGTYRAVVGFAALFGSLLGAMITAFVQKMFVR